MTCQKSSFPTENRLFSAQNSAKMRILTVDLEEYWHILDANQVDFSHFQSRIEQQLECLLAILQTNRTHPTFFILGEMAKKHPDLVKFIARNFDIGSHGMHHRLVNSLSVEEFRQDLVESLDVLGEITGKKITKYRAAGFSLTKKEYFDVLFDCGIEVDSSLSSINHAYGRRVLKENKPCLIESNGRFIKEIPPFVVRLCGFKGFLGGGYFRLSPYWLIKKWTKRAENDYLLAYIHPSDIDFERPKIKELGRMRRFKSHVGLKTAEKKLQKWLNEYDFIDISTAEQQIDWSKVQRIQLK